MRPQWPSQESTRTPHRSVRRPQGLTRSRRDFGSLTRDASPQRLLGGGGSHPQQPLVTIWGTLRTVPTGGRERQDPAWGQPSSPAKGMATETRSGRRSSRIKAKSTTSAPREKDATVLTVQVGAKTGCPLCTASFTLANSMRTHLRRQHNDYRMVCTNRQAPGTPPEISSTGTEDVKWRDSTQRPRCGIVTSRLLSAQQSASLGTWNVRSLRGLGKAQQLVMEMERHKVLVINVSQSWQWLRHIYRTVERYSWMKAGDTVWCSPGGRMGVPEKELDLPLHLRQKLP